MITVLARTAVLCALCEVAAGCTTLEPNTIRTDIQHLSHISQHFHGEQSTHYGAQIVGVEAEWKHKGWFADVGEGYNLGSGAGRQWALDCAGGICGPREITTVTVGYEWRLK